ncbi:endonuclease/exonuclease/phosphatase family protein [Elongatibacter sediminis]|uniref:Endonuclease/exonuclease/phosphatase family protein n=1 Tax=Elongatibacter sediminis TaxID=3119006 RepID=A0AAW9RHN4_9GAMM
MVPILVLALTLTGCASTANRNHTQPDPRDTLRIATFNIAMGREAAGALSRALASGDDPRLRQLASIVQTVRPDILLLNEFDYDPGIDAPALLNDRYLAIAAAGQTPIRYPYAFRAAVNTGIDSGRDLDRDGRTGDPGDAWGFGHFPGQYGMLLLSRHPIDEASVRTFQRFPWHHLPDAHRPQHPPGTNFHTDAVWRTLRLSSKSHWDVPVMIGERTLHVLAFHPTPPVFDGPEDRNGRRNYDEIRFWAEYLDSSNGFSPIDDAGISGGLAATADFVILGDFNADPNDGDSLPGAIGQLIDHPRIDASCVPRSTGAVIAARSQGGVNHRQTGEAAADTADFNDQRTGNLRLDHVLPARGLNVKDCGVFWPAPGEPGDEAITVSDHRLVWLDIFW